VEPNPRARVVLLGASNLTLSFRLVIDRLRAVLPGPIDLMAAAGHGRSYGRTSRVLVRELPGILECGLWPALRAAPPAETLALLADFGNDLVYGSEVEEIAGWIEAILDRLAEHGSRTAVERLPLANVERLSPLRFRIARGILYPRHKIDLESLRERARALDARILALARARGAALVEQSPEWFGLDPIHIRRASRQEAWEQILSPLASSSAARAPEIRASDDRWAMRRLRPERRRWMGRQEYHRQPCARFLDGTRISLY